MSTITSRSIIGEIVAGDYRTAAVFKHYGIDFCCNGQRTIADACKSKNIHTAQLLTDLSQVPSLTADTETDYNAWPLDLLTRHIEQKHHQYVEKKILEIRPYLEKIVRVHSDQHPELVAIEHLFNESARELAMHMKKEELVLFPFIRRMALAAEHQEPLPVPPFGTVENPIAMMQHDHDAEGERFRRIAALSNNYTPPEDACNTYRVTFALLKEFEEDLHLHIHLENNILFPKAIQLEQGAEAH